MLSIQQQQQQCRAALVPMEDMEKAIDAEIAQLLALRQVSMERRTAKQQQLALLQQIAAAQHGSAAPMMQDMPSTPQDDAANLMMELACSTGLAPLEQPWAPAGVNSSRQLSPTSMAAAQQVEAQQAAANSGRTSLDLSCLQLSLALSAAGQQPMQCLESPQTDLMRPAGSELMMQSPFAGPGDGFAAGAHMQAAGVPQSMGMNLNPELAAALSSLTAQSSCMLLNPVTPSPGMSRMGSAGVLGSMQSLQDASCCMGDSMAASAGFAPSAAHPDLLFCGDGQLMSAGVMGSSMHMAPAHRASFSVAPTHPDLAGQPRLRRHSFHVEPMSRAGLASGMQSGMGVLGSIPSGIPDGMLYAAATPAAVDASGRTIRRMSAVVNSTGSLLLAPNMHSGGCAEGLQYPMQYGMSSTRGETVGFMPPAGLSAPPAGSCGPAASCAAQTAMRDAASRRRSFDVSSRTAGAVGRQSLDVPRSSTMVDQAGSILQPRAGGQDGATQPAKKGTGVFMPRVAATPAWKGEKKGRAA